jgi:phosphoribosylformylglycinamidine synthase
MLHVLGTVMEQEVVELWHKDYKLEGFSTDDCIVLPGGFSYGDYLRAGAIARFSHLMNAVIEFANAGGMVWGICNGFQVLCESKLLPGVLLNNHNQRFICKNTYLRTETNNAAITSGIEKGQVLKIPIAHAEGRYFASQDTLDQLEANDQVLFRYCSPDGTVEQSFNPNGSLNSIAGICNEQRNVFGMMPHPERASEQVLGNEDGKLLFESLLASAKAAV